MTNFCVYLSSECSVKDVVFDKLKVHGVVYNWKNLDDLDKHPGGYTGMTVAGINLLDLGKSIRCIEFVNFSSPYAGQKINTARLELPPDKWVLEILAVVEGCEYLEVLKETQSLEEKYIKEFDCVERGYNMTYGGEHGYIKIWKYTPTTYTLRQISVGEDNITLIRIDKDKLPYHLSSFIKYYYEVPSTGIIDEAGLLAKFNKDVRFTGKKYECMEEAGIDLVNLLDLPEKDREAIKKTKQNKIARIGSNYYCNRKILVALKKLSHLIYNIYPGEKYTIEELGLSVTIDESYYSYNVTNSIPCCKVNHIRDKETGQLLEEFIGYASRTHAYYKTSYSYQEILWCVNHRMGTFINGTVEHQLERILDDIIDEQ